MSLSFAELFRGAWPARFSRRDARLLWIAGRSGRGDVGEATAHGQYCRNEGARNKSGLPVLFKDKASPSESDRGKPLMGTEGRPREGEWPSRRCKSIDTTDASEVSGMAMESKQNKPRSVISRMIWGVS